MYENYNNDELIKLLHEKKEKYKKYNTLQLTKKISINSLNIQGEYKEIKLRETP